MKSLTIIGFGRCGQTMEKLLRDDFAIRVYKRSKITTKNLGPHTTIASTLEEAYQSDVLLYCVPIASFEEVIKTHKPYMKPGQLLMDALSVKVHPAKVFATHLKDVPVQTMLTHPMFGPDSTKNGFTDLPMILDRGTTDMQIYTFWKNYFEKKQLRVIEMTPDEHDKIAADSQGVTHFIGRLLDEYGFEESAIDSLGTKKLHEVKDQTCHDTWELFTNLQQYNPYTKHMRLKLGSAYDKLYNKLLPSQIDKHTLTIGIQGGRGSFNEEAIQYYLKRNNIQAYTILYLHTAENVLNALHEGKCDQGLFAMHNSTGGIVMESVKAMARHKFSIIEEFAIIISHALMIRKDATLDEITTIMSHPQVFAQCKQNLATKYPQLQQISGEGELIDHALVAQQLSENKLPKHIATMGSKILADIYDLQIVESNLQDLKENYTSFLLVKRY